MCQMVWQWGQWDVGFLEDVVMHHKDAWDEYQIPASQLDAVLAHLTLFHMHMRCMFDPEFFGGKRGDERNGHDCCDDDVTNLFV